jgi:hypothetical protein
LAGFFLPALLLPEASEIGSCPQFQGFGLLFTGNVESFVKTRFGFGAGGWGWGLGTGNSQLGTGNSRLSCQRRATGGAEFRAWSHLTVTARTGAYEFGATFLTKLRLQLILKPTVCTLHAASLRLLAHQSKENAGSQTVQGYEVKLRRHCERSEAIFVLLEIASSLSLS